MDITPTMTDADLVPAPEKEKNEIITPRHCEYCTELPTFGHFCPSKDCYCFQTPEEQEADIEKFQKECSHPKEELFMLRCLRCGKIRLITHVGRKHIRFQYCEKHKGYSCLCKEKEPAKKS